MRKKLRLTALLLLLTLALSACGSSVPEVPSPPPPVPTPDPHEGELLVANGMGGMMWVKDYENLPVMSLNPKNFVPDGSYINYIGYAAKALRGIDVSEHQREIDWAAVAADGVEFAIIR